MKQVIEKLIAGAPSGAGLTAARTRRDELVAELRSAEAEYAAALRAAATDDGEEARVRALIAGSTGRSAPNLGDLRERAEILRKAVARQGETIRQIEAKLEREVSGALAAEHSVIRGDVRAAAAAALAVLKREAELVAALESAGLRWRGESAADRLTLEVLEAAVGMTEATHA